MNIIRGIMRQTRLWKAANKLDPHAGWGNVPMKELCPIGTILNERQREAVDMARFNEAVRGTKSTGGE